MTTSPTIVVVVAQGDPLLGSVADALNDAGSWTVLTADAAEPSVLGQLLDGTEPEAVVLPASLWTSEVVDLLPPSARIVVLGDRPVGAGSTMGLRGVRVSTLGSPEHRQAGIDTCLRILGSRPGSGAAGHPTPAPEPETEAEPPVEVEVGPPTPAVGSGVDRSGLTRAAAVILLVALCAGMALVTVWTSPKERARSVDLAAVVSADSFVAPPQEADARVAVVRVARQVIRAGSSRPPEGVSLDAERVGDQVRLTARSRGSADLDEALASFTRLVRAGSSDLQVASLPPGARVLVPEVTPVTRDAVPLRGEPLPGALRAGIALLALVALLGRRPLPQVHPRTRAVLAASAAMGLGVAAVATPEPVAVGAVVAVVLACLRAGTWQLAVLALALTALTRPLTDAGVLPSWVNFVDLPVVALAALRAAPRMRRPGRLPLVAAGLAVAVYAASWATSGVSPLRALAAGAVLAQPWVLLAALLTDPPGSERGRKALLFAVLAAGALQVPVALAQAATRGVGDAVAGSYAGSVNGAHTAAAVSMLALLVAAGLALRGITHRRRRPVVGWGLTAAVLGSVMVLADAKQVVLVLPVVVLALLAGLPRRTLLRAAGAVAVAATLLAVLFVGLNPQWRTGVTVFTDAVGGSSGKVVGAEVLGRALSEEPQRWAVGVGPGTTVSRVALLSGDALARPDSAVSSLPLVTQPVTEEVVRRTLPRAIQESSFQSGWSSAFGVLGDFGGLGVLALLLAIAHAARLTRGSWTPLRAAARAGLVAAVLLSFVDNWLEQAAFTVPLMILLALCAPPARTVSPDVRAPAAAT